MVYVIQHLIQGAEGQHRAVRRGHIELGRRAGAQHQDARPDDGPNRALESSEPLKQDRYTSLRIRKWNTYTYRNILYCIITYINMSSVYIYYISCIHIEMTYDHICCYHACLELSLALPRLWSPPCRPSKPRLLSSKRASCQVAGALEGDTLGLRRRRHAHPSTTHPRNSLETVAYA